MGADALAQPDWAQSRCPHCNEWHRESAFVFPPVDLLPAVLAKARADGLRGVMIIPYVPSLPVWQRFMSASVTLVAGQKDPCYGVPATAAYVHHAAELGDSQRLAVFAVDFSSVSRRDFRHCTPLCNSASDPQPRRRVESAVDATDRRRIAHELERLGLTSRSAQAARKRDRF